MAESLAFNDDEIQLLLEVFIKYKAESEYCGVDWESVRDKFKRIKKNSYSAVF